VCGELLGLLVRMLRSRKLLQSFFTKRNFFRNFFRIVPSEAGDDDDLRKNQIRTTAGLFGIENLLTPQDFQNQSMKSLQNCQRLQKQVICFSYLLFSSSTLISLLLCSCRFILFQLPQRTLLQF
jgi:hypothetical protein